MGVPVLVLGGTLVLGVVGIVTPAVRSAVRVRGGESLHVGELVGEPTLPLPLAALGEDVPSSRLPNVTAGLEVGERPLDDVRRRVEEAPEIGRSDRLLDALADHPVHRFQHLVAPEQVVVDRAGVVSHYVSYRARADKTVW